jgi:hypothetical protein
MPTFPPRTSSLTRFCLYTVHTACKHTEEHVKYCLPPAALITNEHGLPSNNKHVVLLRIVLYLAITRFYSINNYHRKNIRFYYCHAKPYGQAPEEHTSLFYLASQNAFFCC